MERPLARRPARLVSLAAYHLVTRWLPPSYVPGGSLFRRLRAWSTRALLAGMGHNVNIEHGASFGDGHQLSVGDNSGVGMNCRIQGPVAIGANVMMAAEVVVIAVSHGHADVSKPMLSQGLIEAPVTIADDVWIGTRAVILPGVHVGQGSIIGAAAVVTRDVPAYTVVAGVPAKVVGSRSASSALGIVATPAAADRPVAG